LLGLGLSSQNNSAGESPDLISESILATERQLDIKIVELNKRLRSHTRLLVLNTKILPSKTVFFKGKAEGDKCLPIPDQTSSEANCLHLEIYDFPDLETPMKYPSMGSKNKTLVLFYATGSQERIPRKVPPGELTRIFSRIHMENFVNGEKVISEITDENPSIEPLQNNNIFLFYQVDGFPFHGTEETPSEKGVGRYSLESMVNIKSEDIRNDFKKRFYVKHLDYYDKLFTKIFNFNDQSGNENYQRNINVLRESLKY
jgi:hypothetical protein